MSQSLTLPQARQLAAELLQAQRFAQALAVVEQIAHALPDDAACRYDLGAVAWRAGREALARESFEAALALAPQETAYRLTLAQVAHAVGDWEAAQALVADWPQPQFEPVRQALNAAHDGRKVFCIGRNKTGTTSVEAALKALGLTLGQQRRGERLLEDWGRRDFTRILALARTAEAFQDVPFSLPNTYRVLDAAFPDARFVLTVRDSPEQWYDSVVRFHSRIIGRQRVPTAADLAAFDYVYKGYLWRSAQLVYGADERTVYDRDLYIGHYLRHNADVVEHFAGRPDSLLVLNVSAPDAMARLCAFLGLDPTGRQMPHLNRSNVA